MADDLLRSMRLRLSQYERLFDILNLRINAHGWHIFVLYIAVGLILIFK